jgi:hypothetical protein
MTLDGACQVAKAACEQLATWDLELAVATAARAVKRLERVPVSPPHGSPGTQADKGDGFVSGGTRRTRRAHFERVRAGAPSSNMPNCVGGPARAHPDHRPPIL